MLGQHLLAQIQYFWKTSQIGEGGKDRFSYKEVGKEVDRLSLLSRLNFPEMTRAHTPASKMNGLSAVQAGSIFLQSRNDTSVMEKV